MDEDEILNARQVAEQNPELDATRRQLFGENYLQDIDQGTGIAQYYTGFGEMPTLDYTPAAAVDTSTPAVDVTQPVVDTGGGGGGIGAGDITTPDTGNTEFEQGLIDQGVGVQGAIGDPVVAPGEMPVTQEEIDAFNAPAILDSESTVDEIAQDLSNQQAMLNPTGGNIMDEVALTGQTDFVNPADVEAGLATESMVDFQTPEQTNAINEAFNSVKDLGEAGVDKLKDSLVALGGKVKEGFDNTIEIGGKTIDLTKSLIGGAISLVSGIPGVGFLLNMLPEGGRSEMSDALGEQYGMDDIGRLTDGPMAGYNVDSLMGKGIEQATIDRINTRKANNLDTKDLENFLEQIERNNLAINYNMEGTDEGDRAAEEAEPEAQDTIADQPPSMFFGNPPLTPMDVKEQYGAIGQYEPYSPTTSFKDQQKAAGDEAAATAREQARDALNAKNAASAAKAAATRREQARADQRGGGGGGGGGYGGGAPSGGVSPGAGNSRR